MSHAALLFKDLLLVYTIFYPFSNGTREIFAHPFPFPFLVQTEHISLFATEIASLLPKGLDFLPGSLKILYIEDRRKNQCDLTNDIGTNKIKFLLEKGEMT